MQVVGIILASISVTMLALASAFTVIRLCAHPDTSPRLSGTAHAQRVVIWLVQAAYCTHLLLAVVGDVHFPVLHDVEFRAAALQPLPTPSTARFHDHALGFYSAYRLECCHWLHAQDACVVAEPIERAEVADA